MATSHSQTPELRVIEAQQACANSQTLGVWAEIEAREWANSGGTEDELIEAVKQLSADPQQMLGSVADWQNQPDEKNSR